MGPTLVWRLYAKPAHSNARRKAPRLEREEEGGGKGGGDDLGFFDSQKVHTLHEYMNKNKFNYSQEHGVQGVTCLVVVV